MITERVAINRKEALTEEQYAKVKQMIDNKAERDPGFKQRLEETNKFIEEMSAHSDKMNTVLNEQTSKILKLHSIASRHDVKFIQENGGLVRPVIEWVSD